MAETTPDVTNKDPQFSIFVGKLHRKATEKDLHDFFQECGGTIMRTTLMTNKSTGRSKGFAYMQFDTEDAMAAAIARDGETLMGKEVRVQPKRPPVRKRKRSEVEEAEKEAVETEAVETEAVGTEAVETEVVSEQ